MTAKRLHVAVLMGGTSSEHDVSVCSGLNVLDALDPARFRATPLYIDRSGAWHLGRRPPLPSLEFPAGSGAPPVSSPSSLPEVAPDRLGIFEMLRGEANLDAVFIALHGPGGEDGTVQGLLTLAGVPYTGSGVLASALAMDKVRTKLLLLNRGMPFARDREVDRAALDDGTRGAGTVDRLVEDLGLPCVVKPVSGGSSFGTSLVRTADALLPALEAALDEDPRVLVETYVAGVEVTCGVLGGGPFEPAVPLPLTEIVPVGEDFFDFRAKYTAAACDEITPARVPEGTAQRVQDLALLAHRLLGCEGVSRTDFIIGSEGPMMLETNTVPGLTRTSLLPQGAAAVGISFDQLVERLLRSALVRAGRTDLDG